MARIRVNSKYDCVLLRQNYPEETWRPTLQSLIDNRFAWYPLPEGKSVEDYPEEDVRTLVETLDGEEVTTVQVHLENPTSRIFRMGFEDAAEMEYLMEHGELPPEEDIEVTDD